MSVDLMGALLLANEEAKQARGTVQARDMEIARLRAELVQVAAVAVKWIEAIDRRTACASP